MIHFKNKTKMLIDMTKDEKNNYLRDVDLNVTDFEIKIADFGLAK